MEDLLTNFVVFFHFVVSWPSNYMLRENTAENLDNASKGNSI